MLGDDERLQDLFPSLSADISRMFQNHVNEPVSHVADAIDNHISVISEYLREVIGTTSWLPDSVKSSGPIIPKWSAPPPPPPSFLERAQLWISRNRAVAAAIVSFLGTGAFLIWQRRRLYRMKRRAKRASGGEKIEVIVLAGSPYSPFASLLASDLDRRGFIVYITVSTQAEEEAVKSLRAKDVRPLFFELTSPSSIANSITDFNNELLSSSSQHILRLSSLLFLPPRSDTFYPIPISSIASSNWSRTLTTDLLYRFTLANAFLPTLTTFANDNQPQNSIWSSRLFSYMSSLMPRYFHHDSTQSSRTSLIVISPSIFPSLCSADNALGNVTFASMGAWLTTLRTELAATNSNLRVIHLRLGYFNDINTPHGSKELTLWRQRNAHVQSDQSNGSNPEFLAAKSNDNKRTPTQMSFYRGSPVRELHNGVFDAIVGTTARYGGTLYLGQGSLVYAMMGSLCPSTLVGWMMRSERVRNGQSETHADGSDDMGTGSWTQTSTEGEYVNVFPAQA